MSVYYLDDNDQFRTDRVSDDSLTSVHLTQLRGELAPQRHVRHHEVIHVVQGAGRLTIDGVKHKIGAGTVISIPPNTPHSFYSMGKVPTVLISVFSPPFDGKDRIYENPSGK
jgi:mannose-6-phosphate isomerase-like protein (cupin superfamily)